MLKKEDVMNALKKVIDPELGISIVALGLIYEIRILGTNVDVDMTLTSPGCPIAPQIMAEAERQILKLKNVKSTKVEFVFDPPWTPDKMSPEARMQLGI